MSTTVEFEIDGSGNHVFRKPSRGDYDRFVTEIQDPKRNSVSAMRALVMSCAVEPSGREAMAVFDEWPGLLDKVASQLIDLATPDVEITVKKGG